MLCACPFWKWKITPVFNVKEIMLVVIYFWKYTPVFGRLFTCLNSPLTHFFVTLVTTKQCMNSRKYFTLYFYRIQCVFCVSLSVSWYFTACNFWHCLLFPVVMMWWYTITRNTLGCDQSNYSSRIVFSHIPIAFVQTGISAIRFADPENPILEPNTA